MSTPRAWKTREIITPGKRASLNGPGRVSAWACGLALAVGAILSGGADLAAQAGVPDTIRGVAVTVELEGGLVAPAIFLGNRASAASATEGAFHFHSGGEGLHILRPGARWAVVEGAGDGVEPEQVRLAVTIRDEGSWLPGGFNGPEALAREVSRTWAAAHDLEASVPDRVLVIPVSTTRVRPIPLGAAVRGWDPGPE